MKFPLGIQTFEKIREGGFTYIDKTKLIYELVNNNEYCFLSRPRRFGKSLLMSTIEAYFQGRKDLFEGLNICKYESEWIKHPVLHFDLNAGNYEDEEGLDSRLTSQLEDFESQYGIVSSKAMLSDRFEYLIRSLYQNTGTRVVILIDEYDKPLLSKSSIANKARLKSFYSVLKTCDKYIKFAMVTGVTKLSRLSIFSDLNNLKDLSLNPKYATICGLTKSEILQCLGEPLSDMASEKELDKDALIAKLEKMYNGYRFSSAEQKVFNPFSLFNSLEDKEFNNYWFESGTPTVLVDLYSRDKLQFSELEGIRFSASALMSANVDIDDPIPVTYQAGYLTIKEYDKKSNIVTLGYPNQEVRQSFLEFLLPYCSNVRVGQANIKIDELRNILENGDVDGFMEELKSLLAHIPHAKNKDYEFSYRDTIYIIANLLGYEVDVEKSINTGVIDLVIGTRRYIYVLELKVNTNPLKALEQINSKSYAIPYMADGRKLIKVGINFNTKIRNIENWIVEE